jgi:hypothetical protein
MSKSDEDIIFILIDEVLTQLRELLEDRAERIRQLEARLAAKCTEVDVLLEQRGNEALEELRREKKQSR